jgi:hypothetical protein
VEEDEAVGDVADEVAAVGKPGVYFDDEVVVDGVEDVVGDVEDAVVVVEVEAVEPLACFAAGLVLAAVAPVVAGLEVRMDLAIPISQVVL